MCVCFWCPDHISSCNPLAPNRKHAIRMWKYSITCWFSSVLWTQENYVSCWIKVLSGIRIVDTSVHASWNFSYCFKFYMTLYTKIILLNLVIAGRLLTALICEYMDWAQLNHTLKVYLPECNLVRSPHVVTCSIVRFICTF